MNDAASINSLGRGLPAPAPLCPMPRGRCPSSTRARCPCAASARNASSRLNLASSFAGSSRAAFVNACHRAIGRIDGARPARGYCPRQHADEVVCLRGPPRVPDARRPRVGPRSSARTRACCLTVVEPERHVLGGDEAVNRTPQCDVVRRRRAGLGHAADQRGGRRVASVLPLPDVDRDGRDEHHGNESAATAAGP